MTSNLGVNSNSRSTRFVSLSDKREQGNDDFELRAQFRPEFINRIDHIIHFQNLNSVELEKVADLGMRQLVNRLKDQKILLTYEQNIFHLLVEEAGKDGGARGLNSAIEKLIEIPLSEFLLRDLDFSW